MRPEIFRHTVLKLPQAGGKCRLKFHHRTFIREKHQRMLQGSAFLRYARKAAQAAVSDLERSYPYRRGCAVGGELILAAQPLAVTDMNERRVETVVGEKAAGKIELIRGLLAEVADGGPYALFRKTADEQPLWLLGPSRLLINEIE